MRHAVFVVDSYIQSKHTGPSETSETQVLRNARVACRADILCAGMEKMRKMMLELGMKAG